MHRPVHKENVATGARNQPCLFWLLTRPIRRLGSRQANSIGNEMRYQWKNIWLDGGFCSDLSRPRRDAEGYAANVGGTGGSWNVTDDLYSMENVMVD